MSENSAVRSYLVSSLQKLDAFPVENPICPGTPDVYCLRGWIEAKYLPGWPKRPKTPVRIPHYTPEQRRWAERHESRGGRVWLVVAVRYRDWMVFRGAESREKVGYITQQEMLDLALYRWPKRPLAEQLLEVFQ